MLPRGMAAIAAAFVLAGGCGRATPPVETACPVLPAMQVRPAGEFVAADTAEISPAPAATDSPRAYVVDADTAYQRADSPLVQLCGVRVQLFDSLGVPSGDLTARSGEYDPESGAMVVRGEVVVELREGNRRVETEELHYQPREDRIWSPVETRIEQDGLRMRAASFTSDSRLEKIEAQRARGWFRW